MALRLILVSAVAGLGLSLPSAEQLQTWGHSTQRWINARLADWDARMPADENAFVLVTEPTTVLADTPEPIETPAATTTPAPAPTTVHEETSAPATTPTPEAVPVTASAVPEVAQATSTDLIPTPEAVPVIAPAVAEVAQVTPADGLDAPTAPMALDETESAPAAPSTPAPQTLDTAFNDAQEGTLSSFASDAEALAASEAPVATPTPFEPLDVDDNFYPGAAFALNREAEGLCLQSVTAASPRPEPRFEPMDVDSDLYPGTAFALNREAEGLAHPSASTPEQPDVATVEPAKAAESADARGRLTQAVRLTREAVNAWASLLHGPAVVIISR